MQSGHRCQPPWRKEHLWLALQALGFEPGVEAVTLGKTMTHVTFGVNMFDKPNKDACYVVFHFLFSKLNGAQCKDVFRYCWPPLDKKKDAEFRKTSYEWLRKISEDAGNGFPQVVASIFLSPGGPKLVQLLYHFVRYVMLQHIKRDVDGTSSFIPDSLQCCVQDPQKALARNKMARHKYLQTLQRESFVIREYQKKAQLLVKQIRDLRSECVTLQNQYREARNVKTDEKNKVGLEEIRSLWDNIMHKLKAIEKEVEVVDSVVCGDVDQFVLDGSKVSLNIPSVLVTRIESEMHRLQMENVYEAGKVNLITIIQLLNEALQIIHSEHSCSGGKDLQVDLQYLAAKVAFETEVFTRLKHTRHRIKREDLVSINKSIVEKEKDWEKKWKRILGKSPFSLFKRLNPVLELQPPLAPLSFDPAAEEALNSSVFSQYPSSLPDMRGKDLSVSESECDSFTIFMDGTLFTPRGRKSLPFHSKVTPSERRMSLNEKDFRTPTSIRDGLLQKTPVSLPQKRTDVTWQTSPSSALVQTPTPCKQNAMTAARLHLAQQVADYIVNESPRAQSGRGMELDDLIGMLSSDPFLSRKEIPRTPEHLITDIRTSWRKAIETEEFCDLSSPTEDPCVQSPTEHESAHCSQVDLSMACFLSASHLSEHSESPDARAPPPAGESSPHEQDVLSPNVMTSFIGEQKRTEQDKFTPLNKYDKNTLGSSFEQKNHTLVSSHFSTNRLTDNTILMSAPILENSSTHSTPLWHSSKVMDCSNRSDSSDVIQFGILHETIPDVAGNSLNSTTSVETPEDKRYDGKVEDHELDLDSMKCGLKAMEPKTDLESIRNRYEALKRNIVTSLAEDRSVAYSPVSRVAKQKSESDLPVETDNVFSDLDKGLSLDFEYLTTLSPRDRKLSLPQLISFSPCEDEVWPKNTEDCSDVFESQGTGKINETFDYTHSMSDLQKGTDEGVGQLIL